MILVGIAGIKDNLRDGVKEAVKKCKVAGITVRMVRKLLINSNIIFK